jgi:hypothetical protein
MDTICLSVQALLTINFLDFCGEFDPKYQTMSQEIYEKCEELVKLRKRPLLLLLLQTIQRVDVISTCDALSGSVFNEMDVVLQTPGGDPDAAYLLTKVLRKHGTRVFFLIPVYAKSAGTLMCLGADELIVTEVTELGPLDSQIREEQEGSSSKFSSALNGFKALEQIQLHTLQTLEIAARMIRRHNMKLRDVFELATRFAGETSGTLYAQLDPKKIGEYARALDVGEKYGIIILTRFMNWPKDKATQVVRRLVKDYPSHDFVIDHEEMTDIGLPAKLADSQTAKVMNEIRDLTFQLGEDESDHIKLFKPVTPVTPVINPPIHASIAPPSATGTTPTATPTP